VSAPGNDIEACLFAVMKYDPAVSGIKNSGSKQAHRMLLAGAQYRSFHVTGSSETIFLFSQHSGDLETAF
jgi:hypothetical protein